MALGLTRFVIANLLRRKFRTVLTAGGIATAVAAVVALWGIADTFERSFSQLYESRGVDLIVVRGGNAERLAGNLDAALQTRLEALPGVKAVAPGLVDVVTLEKEDLIGVPIQGWVWNSFQFDNLKLGAGRTFTDADNSQRVLMLGAILARNLNKSVGDVLEIQLEPFTIVGIYESTNIFENGSAVIPLPVLQTLMDRPGQVTDFQVIVSPDADRPRAETVAAVSQVIEGLADESGKALNLSAFAAQDFVQGTMQIQITRAMARVTSFIALFIGACGMMNTMMMSVFERTSEIGILRALGWRPRKILNMVLAEAVMLSLLGAIVGIVAAVVFVKGCSMLPGINGFLSGEIAPYVMLEGLLIAVLVGLIGGLYPACRGARLSPVEAIRHD